MQRERTEEGAEEAKEIKKTLRRGEKKIENLQKRRRLRGEDKEDEEGAQEEEGAVSVTSVFARAVNVVECWRVLCVSFECRYCC